MKQQSLIIRIRPKTPSASPNSKTRHEPYDAAIERTGKNTTHLPPVRIACTRFNTQTWQEYQDWKTAHEQAYEQTYSRQMKCVYGSPREISYRKFPPEIPILIIEMNNDANRIMGIGQIQNRTASESYRRPPTGANANTNTTTAISSVTAAATQAHTLQAPPRRRPVVGGRNPHQIQEDIQRPKLHAIHLHRERLLRNERRTGT